MTLASLFYGIGQWSGIIAFFSLSLIIFSGDTARFWDRYFGLDRIIKFQRKFALFTAAFVVLHPLFFLLSGMSVSNILLPDYSVLPLALGITSFYIFALVMICSWLYKRISYRAWQYIHVLTYILFGFTVYHAFFWGSDSADPAFMIFYGAWIVLVLIGIVFRTQYKWRKRRSSRCRVQSVEPETEDTFTLTLRSNKPLDFHAGQFCFLRLDRNNLHARHPFTIASAPGGRDVKFTIRNTGRFTQTASELKPGDEIFVDGPFGTFIEDESNGPLVMIAGGVGITPFISMLRRHMKKKPKRDIVLLYSSKTKKDVIFKKELDALHLPWFKKMYLITNETGKKENDTHYGRISKDVLASAVRDIPTASFYLCGPQGLKDAVKGMLRELGVPARNIHAEDFFW